jgi:DNA-binding winged helix-turn-helix (wHTH) protein/TolB-like protein/Tfp pilus assembly protein PilF
MSKHGQRIYEFGPFRLDADNHALLREGRPVTLTRKAVEMLIVLVESRGEVLGKEALLKRLWPDTTVEDSNLTQNVYMIRQALGEGAQQQTYIETVPKRGYRFAAEVTEITPNGHGHPATTGGLAPPPDSRTAADPHTTTDPHTTADATAATTPSVADPHTTDAHTNSPPFTTASQQSATTAAHQSAASGAGVISPAPNAHETVPPDAAVTSPPAQAALTAPLLRRPRLGLIAVVAAVIIALAFAIAGYLSRNRRTARPADRVRVIAVLPLKHIGPEGEAAHLGLGMTDAMITKLSNLQQIQVRPTSAVFKYTAADYDPVQAGKELEVDAVVEGSVQRAGDSVRVTVRLLSIPDGQPLWGEIYNKQATDVFAVQDAISEEVAQALKLKLTSEERSQLSKHHTQNPEAYQAYARGFYFWNLRTEDGFRQSIKHYEEAVAKDSSYALAYAGLADSYGLVAYYRYERIAPRDVALGRAREMAARAVELDSELPEAHAATGLVRSLESDIEGAASGYKRALAINPNYATARQRYALILLNSGRLEEATAEMLRAQSNDPLSTVISLNLAQMYYFARDYDRAAATCEKALETSQAGMSQLLLLNLLGSTRAVQGRHEEARALFRRALEQDDEFDEAREGLAFTAALAGDREGAIKYFPRFRQLSAQYPQAHLSLAVTHSALGETDEAFKDLERFLAAESGPAPTLRFDPRLDRLRADPRFADLMKRRFDRR